MKAGVLSCVCRNTGKRRSVWPVAFAVCSCFSLAVALHFCFVCLFVRNQYFWVRTCVSIYIYIYDMGKDMCVYIYIYI